VAEFSTSNIVVPVPASVGDFLLRFEFGKNQETSKKGNLTKSENPLLFVVV
jgi:hypothetical protein